MSGGFGLPIVDIAGGLAKVGQAYRDSYDEARRQTALTKLGEQIGANDYSGAARTALAAGDVGTGLGLLKLGQTAEQQRTNSAALGGLVGIFGAGGPVGVPGGPQARSSNVPSFLDVTDGAQGDYLAGLFKRESNNNPNAQASTSSARGLGQFTTGTWNRVAAQNPDLGLTPVGPGQDGRTDPQQMVKATRALTSENEGLLQGAGLPVTDASRYALHFLGGAGGRRLVAGAMRNPDAPAASYASADAVAANRNVFFGRDGSPKSAGEVMNDFARSFGGGGAPTAQPRPPQVASADPTFAPQMPGGPGSLSRPLQAPAVAQPPAPPQPRAAAPDGTPAIPPLQAVMPQLAQQQPQQQGPGSGPQASIGAALPPGLSGGEGRGPIGPAPGQGQAPSPVGAPGSDLPAPVLPMPGAVPPGRTMTMPGADDGALSPQARVQASVQAPQQLAQADVPAPVAASIGATAPGSQQRIGALLRVSMLPGMDEGQRSTVSTLLHNELEQTKLPDVQKNYLLARSQGFGGTFLDYQNAQRAPLTPTTVSPGTAVIFPGERAPAYVAPRAPVSVPAGNTLVDPATGQPVYTAPVTDRGEDEASKISGQIAARKAAAPGLGYTENTPAWRSFVTTGKSGSDREMSVAERKAIETADNGVISAQSTIGLLQQAKELSAKAYSGPFASERGKFTGGVLNDERGQATQELDNVVTSNALSQLKSIFGAAPTEGERKILLEIQGSSSLPHPLRLKVYDRASQAAELRLQQNLDRRNQIQDGTYYRPGGGVSVSGGQQAPAGGARPDQRALPPPSPSNRPGAASAGDRFGQLVGSGMSKADAYQQLHREGY